MKTLPAVSVCEQLAGAFSGLEAIPDAVARMCDALLMDLTGICVAARRADYVAAALRATNESGVCTLIGHAGAFNPATAALCNGTAANGEDYDDTFEGGPVHAGAVIVPALMAAAVAPDEAPSATFHAALAHELDAAAFADVQARVRTRVLRTFVRRGLIDKDDAAEMRAWAHDGGFSVDGSVRIEGTDRVGLERLAHLCPSAFRPRISAPTRCRASGLPQSQAGAHNSARRTPGGAGADATRTDHEDRRAGAAAKGASSSLLWCARAQCTATRCGDGARSCRRLTSADFCGIQRRAPSSRRVALSLGHAAGAHL